jgi:LPS sulfotransferase NodH
VIEPDCGRVCYLVLAEPRSGSYLLCDALGRSGIVGYPLEYFGEPQRRLLTKRAPCSYPQYVEGLLQVADDMWGGTFGSKVMWRQLRDNLLPGIRGMVDVKVRSDSALLSAVFPNLRLVRLMRQDRIAQAVSYYRAIQSNCWTRTMEKVAPRYEGTCADAEETYDYQAIAKLVAGLSSDERAVTEFLSRSAFPKLTLAYEEFVASYEQTVLRVLTFLNAAKASSSSDIAPPIFQRQADALSEQWIRWYRSDAALNGDNPPKERRPSD